MNGGRAPRTRYERVAGAADAELAQRQLDRLTEAAGDDPGQAAPEVRQPLAAVLGASSALGDYLVAHPDQWRCLLPQAPDAVAALATDPPDTVADLRAAYQRGLLQIAAADLTGEQDVEAAMDRLTTLADATLAAAYRIAAGDRPAAPVAVVAMGKCGGRELNYLSDVDAIFVAEDDDPDLARAATVASSLIRICGQVAWPVDAALRPEGSRGALVRTLASHLAYYQHWARTWEFQALLKARPAAGDTALGARWRDALQPLVWQAATRPEAVSDIRDMRQRIIDNVPRDQVDREIKRGPGGLRDIEFAVQLLQLVHGRGDETLRAPGTLPALRALVDGGYVGRDDGDALVAAYRFLRTVEHRLQLQRLRRTHLVPEDPQALRWLAHALGYRGEAVSAAGDAVAAFRADWAAHAGAVRRLHAKLLYRPLLSAVARVPTDSLRLTPEAARARLEVLGFAEPAAALRHLEALTGGVSRAAAIQHTLLPVLLEEFAAVPEPDRGLLAYRQVSETLGTAPWYLRLLRDSWPVAQRLARVLGLSRYCTELFARDPDAVRILASDDELAPRGPQALHQGFATAADRHLADVDHEPASTTDATTRPQPQDRSEAARDAVTAVRALRRQELLRTACADVLHGDAFPGDAFPGDEATAGQPGDEGAPPGGGADTVGRALTQVMEATLAAALQVAQTDAPPGLRFALIGMGRLGGREVSYPSDADVLFVYEPTADLGDEAAATAAHTVAERLRSLLSAPAPDPPLGIDADLRPEGRQGPLVRSLAAYEQYYQRWAGVWEAQALLRARYVAGDRELADRFLALADRVRYPAGGLSRAQLVEIRRIKARVETERMPRGADPRTHTKLGRGGLADVEWTVQLLQLRYGAEIPGLRTTSTLQALSAAEEADLVTTADAAALASGWRLAARVRNALTLVRGRPADALPAHGTTLAAVALLLGHSGAPGEFHDHYLRVARHSRVAMEHLFHG